MVHHAFIDESGTREHQGIMTVAAVVLDGAKAAAKLHESVMKELNPKYLELVKERKKQRRKLPSMHFADMSEDAKSKASAHLAKANVSVFSASFWYDQSEMDHDERFSIYKQLVKIVITQAFNKHENIEIAIAKQGGWQQYEREFLAEVKQIPQGFMEQNKFCKGNAYLVSAAKPGIQLADFYVGCIRDYHRNMPAVHDKIERQVLSYGVYKRPATEKKER